MSTDTAIITDVRRLDAAYIVYLDTGEARGYRAHDGQRTHPVAEALRYPESRLIGLEVYVRMNELEPVRPYQPRTRGRRVA